MAAIPESPRSASSAISDFDSDSESAQDFEKSVNTLNSRSRQALGSAKDQAFNASSSTRDTLGCLSAEADAFGGPSRAASTTNVAERIWSDADNANLAGDLDLEVKVICVGMMRTGLKTLHQALRGLGYSHIYDQEDVLNTYHQWDRVLRDGDESALGEIFRGHEVVMGMPTFCFWEQVTKMYPNAKVILTVREEEDWWQSVCHTWNFMEKDLPGAPLKHGSKMRWCEQWLVPSYHKYCEALRFAWKTTLGVHALGGESGLNEVLARNCFRRHNAYVEATLGTETLSDGSPRLLVYNVAKDGWKPLSNFLGKSTPQAEVEFPCVTGVPCFPGGEVKGTTPSYEEQLLPDLDSEFADQVRREMRRGLFLSAAILTLVAGIVIAGLARYSIEVPPSLTCLGFLSLLVVSWNVHVVLQGLVLRVPALFMLPTAMKGLFIAGALQACFISYGILKEMLVTQDKIASPVLVLSSRLGAIVCAVAFLFLTEGKVTLGAPITSMAAFAITNEASTWAGYEMLKYVAFPVQVMAKSVKMLPSMLMGRVVNGTRYSYLEYGQAILALICVAIMNFSDSGSSGSSSGKSKSATPGDMSSTYKMGMGVLMLGLFFVCDSFTSQWQAVLYKKHPKLTQTQMMLGGNLLGFFVTATTAVASWSKVQSSMALALANPAIAGRIACLGVVYALGQFCIYSAIRILGPLTFTWIMTARQLLSVLISLVLFGHGINFVKVICILMVFSIMSAKHLTKAAAGLKNAFCNFKHQISSSNVKLAGDGDHSMPALLSNKVTDGKPKMH